MNDGHFGDPGNHHLRGCQLQFGSSNYPHSSSVANWQMRTQSCLCPSPKELGVNSPFSAPNFLGCLSLISHVLPANHEPASPVYHALCLSVVNKMSTHPLLQQLSDRDHSIASPLHLRKHFPQHRSRPAPPVVTDDDASRPQHAEYMFGIHTPQRDVRIMWVDAAKYQPIAQLC